MKDIARKIFYEDDYINSEYVSAPFDDALLQEIESELGYKLPTSYVELMRIQNGGVLKRDACPCDVPTSWANDHVGVSHILGIGREKEDSLCGRFGSRFWIEEWEYPDIGVAIAGCPSAGHDMIFLDYRYSEEPSVVHIDQENDYKITVLAENFEVFLSLLCEESEFE